MRRARGWIMATLFLLPPAAVPGVTRVLAAEPEPVVAPIPSESTGPSESGAPSDSGWPTGSLAAAAPRHDDGFCDRCGCDARVTRVPVAKPVVREIKKVCWAAREEELIVPGPSCLCGRRHGRDACGCFWWNLWKPTWARVVTRTVPVKREVTRKVPGYEWILEERCCRCRHDRRPTEPVDSGDPAADEKADPTQTD